MNKSFYFTVTACVPYHPENSDVLGEFRAEVWQCCVVWTHPPTPTYVCITPPSFTLYFLSTQAHTSKNTCCTKLDDTLYTWL